jgi:4-hydroxybenzoate polyprenyltransferase
MQPNTARRARTAGAPPAAPAAIEIRWEPPPPGRRANALALLWREARPSVQAIVQLRYWSAVVLAGGGFGVRPALGSFFLLLAYCAVYALNGVADITEDRANRSRRPIASGAIAPRTAGRLTACLAAVALAGAAALGWRFLAAVALLLALGWIYSMPPWPAKKDYRSSSVVIFGLGAATYLAGWCAGGRSGPSGRLVAVGLAMSLWMVFGGMTKDLSDVAGDRAAGRRSWPVAFGEEGSRTGIVLAAAVLGVSYASIGIAAFHELCFAALVVAAGAACAGACAATSLSRGDRSKARRPYKIFMITQYATHVLLLCGTVALAD